jgi:uncharacterized protein
MLLIDGHNLIGQLSGMRLDDPDDEEQLLIRLRAYRACVGGEMIVYFDPGQTYQVPARRFEAGITIRVAALGQEADQLIVHEIQRHVRPQDLTVISSDHAIQEVARGRGCRVVEAAAFATELAQPARRKCRRGRPRTRSGDAPRLTTQEVQEWLQMFERPSESDRPNTARRLG